MTSDRGANFVASGGMVEPDDSIDDSCMTPVPAPRSNVRAASPALPPSLVFNYVSGRCFCRSLNGRCPLPGSWKMRVLLVDHVSRARRVSRLRRASLAYRYQRAISIDVLPCDLLIPEVVFVSGHGFLPSSFGRGALLKVFKNHGWGKAHVMWRGARLRPRVGAHTISTSGAA